MVQEWNKSDTREEFETLTQKISSEGFFLYLNNKLTCSEIHQTWSPSQRKSKIPLPIPQKFHSNSFHITFSYYNLKFLPHLDSKLTYREPLLIETKPKKVQRNAEASNVRRITKKPKKRTHTEIRKERRGWNRSLSLMFENLSFNIVRREAETEVEPEW